MSDGVGGEAYGYDRLGRTISLTKTIGATNYPLAYAYNLASELTSITYPSGRVVAQSFDKHRPSQPNHQQQRQLPHRGNFQRLQRGE
jgi:YD repeat-containing protein